MTAVTSETRATSRASVSVVSGVVLGVGVVAFVVLALTLIPWHPYPGGRLHVPPASAIFTPTQIARATTFSHIARWLERSSLAVSVVVACLIGFTPPRRRLSRRLRGPWPVRVLEAVVALVLVGQLVTLPFSVLLEREEHRTGLSRASWGAFAGSTALGALLQTVAIAAVLLVLLACARRWPRAWPAIVGLLFAALVGIGSFVYPIAVAPLFTQTRPMPAGPLRTAIMRVAAEEHVHLSQVLLADVSQRTTELNAYVIGFGSTREVVLYDNLVHQLSRREILVVVAHELGHAHYDDVLHGTLLGMAAALIAAGLAGLLLRRLPARGDVRGRETVGAVVAFALAVYAVGALLATPVENVLSRRIETRADVAALRTTRDEKAFVGLQRQLAVSSLADPTPPAWSQFVFGSHPTALQRIAVAERILGR